MATEAQRRAMNKYRRDNVRSFSLSFYPKDADILEFFEAQENKSGYIKELIRQDMTRTQQENIHS